MQEKWTSHKYTISNTRRQPGHTRLRNENGHGCRKGKWESRLIRLKVKKGKAIPLQAWTGP
jgi:hypothetical protein